MATSSLAVKIEAIKVLSKNIYKSLYNDKKWKEKYKERLEDFQYYYEIKYSHVLNADS